METLLFVIPVLLILWLFLELLMRWVVESPLKTDFYSSIPRELIPQRQAFYGVQVASGAGWLHLGWIADPERETYRVEKMTGGDWKAIGTVQFGSFLWRGEGGEFRVWAVRKLASLEAHPTRVIESSGNRLIGRVRANPSTGPSLVYTPRICGPWRLLFKPKKSGDYINDHTIFRDSQGNWRLVGITSKTNGDFNTEKYFTVGISPDFPPEAGMVEAKQIADFGELAWAPFVSKTVFPTKEKSPSEKEEEYYLFWSPHRLHQMTSPDGIAWENHRVSLPAPHHKFFRDAMVFQIAENQWLLCCTARDRYYSQMDVYQSFDGASKERRMQEWQYICTALRSGWGSERNSPFASMESPQIIYYQGHYYLSVTYNNNSFFWPGILLTFKIWLNRASYNDTLVFHADNPFDFGVYRGKKRSPSLLTCLETHAPEWVVHPQTSEWYITTCGWPWVSTLTQGEVAVANLEWIEPLEGK